MAYADVEALLTDWLAATLTVRCVTDLPADLEAALPLVRVTRIAGGDPLPTLDQPLVDIDCFAAGRQAAHDLAEEVRSALRLALPGQSINGAVVTRVETAAGPAWRPYDDPHLSRCGATYRVTIHSRP